MKITTLRRVLCGIMLAYTGVLVLGETKDDSVASIVGLKELVKAAEYVETFEEDLFLQNRWVKSTNDKYSGQKVSSSSYYENEKDKGLVLELPAKHYGLASKLKKPLQLDETKHEMVIQYEVKLQNGLTCGGSYVKLLRQDTVEDLSAFSDKTPFVIMFGPDKCVPNDKVHFIFQHQNPVSKQYEEKHLEKAPTSKSSDTITHLYTLVVRNDNTFEMFIDQKSVSKGSLLENFIPPVNPPQEIDDPEDVKPEDWVEEPMMKDLNAVKPDDWDENEPARIPDESAEKPEDWRDDEEKMIPDPEAPKPEDWDDEDDGEWIAPVIPNPKCSDGKCGEWVRPTIANPKYKGKWKAPMIPNPDYKGDWEPRKIPNPDYFEDLKPALALDPIGAVAIEIWTMSGGITFDNFWMGYDLSKAKEFAETTWLPKYEAEMKEAEKIKEEADKQKNEKNQGFMGQVSTLVNKFSESEPLIQAAIILGAGVSFLGLILLCCLPRASTPAPTADAKAKKEESGEDDVVDDKDTDVNPAKGKLRQRKKAPIAD